MEFLKQKINDISTKNKYIYLFILGLFIINIFWFNGLQSHTIMGDDLVNWSVYKETPHFVESVITNISFEKYRPVFNIFEFSLFKMFSSNMSLFFLFNILFNFIIILLFYFLIKKITKNNIIAFCSSLLYLTSHFSYYNILQITGFLEALSILWIILMVYSSVLYFSEKKIIWIYCVLFLNLIIIFTHERFIVLLPFILAVINFGPNLFKNLKQKYYLSALAVLPLLLNIFLKKIIFGINFFEGTGGTAIKLNLLEVVRYLVSGFLNIVGFNVGPEYLSGVTFNQLDAFSKIISFLIFSTILYILVISVIKLKNASKLIINNELKIFIIWTLLFGSLLLAASITIRQEFRWLYAPYLIFIIYLSYLISKNFINKKLYLIIIIFILLNLFNNIEYKKHIGNVFFVYGQKISDSFYDGSIKKYGCNGNQFIIEKFDSFGWILPADLFLKPYTCYNSFIKYVDNVKDVDLNNFNKNKDFVYKLNWPERKMEEIKIKLP